MKQMRKKFLYQSNKKSGKAGILPILMIIGGIGILILILLLGIPQEKKTVEEIEDKTVEEKDITWCVDNTESYVSCKNYQRMDEGYCETSYNKMESSVNDIDREKNRCRMYVKLFDVVKKGNSEECKTIAEGGDYGEYGQWDIMKCFLLTAESKDDCKKVSLLPDEDEYPQEKEKMCNIFFDYLENGRNGEFNVLDEDSKNLLIFLKSIRTKDSSLCDGISLDKSKPDNARQKMRRMVCEILSGEPKAQKEDFCEPLIAYC